MTSLGPLPENAPVGVAVGIAPRDPADLKAVAAVASIPGTWTHDHRPSAAAATDRFGALPSSVAAALAYFRGFGLNVTANPDGLLLYVEGRGGDVGKAFGTTFERYVTPEGRVFYDHPSAAYLPAVAPWTGAIGLGSYATARPSVLPASPQPSATCGGPTGGLPPCAIAQAYSFAPLFANGTNGTGVRIGIVDAYSGLETQNDLTRDLTTFTIDAGLSFGSVTFLYPVPTTVPLNLSTTNRDWQYENALDLEWARASAPNASLVMTFSPDSGAGLYAAIDALVAGGRVDVLSLSWGEPDVGVFNAYNGTCTYACNASSDGSYAILTPVLELAAIEGISVFAASGDCGSADGTSGVATNYPASDPYVTGVGGTYLALSAGGGWGSETGWSGNATGAVSPGCQNRGGSGGGFAPYPRPWWQTGLPTSPSGRGVPDISIDAQNPVAIVVGNSSTGAAGTSVGTPIWAGIAAVADQTAGSDLGLLNPALYRLAAGPSASLLFHDIVTGSNGYLAAPGWDPVTGLGSPIVSALVPALTASLFPARSNLSTLLGVDSSAGGTLHTFSFVLTVTGGTAPYALQGIYFGDGNATLTTSGSASYIYGRPGVYSAQSFVIDGSGNASVSPPVAVVVGGGSLLTVVLNASNSSIAPGGSVTFTVTVLGGVAPYSYAFSFGDGSYAKNLTVPLVVHRYSSAGGACVQVTVEDAASPPNGGSSVPFAISVGNLSVLSCASPVVPGVAVPVLLIVVLAIAAGVAIAAVGVWIERREPGL